MAIFKQLIVDPKLQNKRVTSNGVVKADEGWFGLDTVNVDERKFKMDNNELLHYGVPGMRWGHRKKQQYELNQKRAQAKADNDDDEEHSDYKKTLERKSLKAMSTKEIGEVNQRIIAENQYRQLTMSKKEKVAEWFKGLMIDTGKNSAKRFVDHYANAGVDALTGVIDEKTPFGNLFGLRKKAEQNRKSEEVKLDKTRKEYDAIFGKKEKKAEEEPKKSEEKPKKEEPKKSEEKPKKEEPKKEAKSEASYEYKTESSEYSMEDPYNHVKDSPDRGSSWLNTQYVGNSVKLAKKEAEKKKKKK